MAEVCKLLDIDKQHTTPYKSSSNGQAERMHRTINSIIGKMVSENQSICRPLVIIPACRQADGPSGPSQQLADKINGNLAYIDDMLMFA